MRKRLSAIVAALLIAMSGSAFAQVATTGTITVVVQDKDGFWRILYRPGPKQTPLFDAL